MKPLFPHFKKITLNDKTVIEYVTNNFPPYSDYHFFSIWSYNVQDAVEYSFLNENLVIKFQEYEGNDFFYSFMGSNQVDETISTLLIHAGKESIQPMLKLLPEHNFTTNKLHELQTNFIVEEDPDNFDYILSVETVFKMNGPELHQKKKSLNKFFKLYDARVVFYDLKKDCTPDLIKSLQDFLQIWISEKKSISGHNENEILAINRTFQSYHNFNLKMNVVYINGNLKGFTVFEQVSKDYAISSFQKADRDYFGIYEFLNHSVIQYLYEQKCLYLNIEQDLGIPGLRQAKRKYYPSFLKKYTISSHK